MTRIRRLAFATCIAITIFGLAGGALPGVLFDDLSPVDPLFNAIPFLTLPAYEGAILGHAPSLEVRSPRAPPLA